MDELLLARIPAEHIHFHAQPETRLGDLPRANIAEKTDMLYGGGVGMALGAMLGLLAGLLAVMFPPWYVPAYKGTILLITTAIGAITGAAWTAMVAVALPNSKIKEYKSQLARGQVLLMVIAQLHRVKAIRELVQGRHAQVEYGGVWPVDHDVFP